MQHQHNTPSCTSMLCQTVRILHMPGSGWSEQSGNRTDLSRSSPARHHTSHPYRTQSWGHAHALACKQRCLTPGWAGMDINAAKPSTLDCSPPCDPVMAELPVSCQTPHLHAMLLQAPLKLIREEHVGQLGSCKVHSGTGSGNTRQQHASSVQNELGPEVPGKCFRVFAWQVLGAIRPNHL